MCQCNLAKAAPTSNRFQSVSGVERNTSLNQLDFKSTDFNVSFVYKDSPSVGNSFKHKKKTPSYQELLQYRQQFLSPAFSPSLPPSLPSLSSSLSLSLSSHLFFSSHAEEACKDLLSYLPDVIP